MQRMFITMRRDGDQCRANSKKNPQALKINYLRINFVTPERSLIYYLLKLCETECNYCRIMQYADNMAYCDNLGAGN